MEERIKQKKVVYHYRKTQRYESIKVSYLDQNFKKKIRTFKGYTAQIIQHELDHFEGKII